MTLEDGNQQPAPTPEQSVPVKVTGGSPFVVEQTPDSPGKLGNLYDGDPATSWATDSYNDQLGGGFKTGTGAVLTFASPTTLREVVIDSPSAGTVVEIRAADGTSPDLNSSKVIGQQTLSAGQTTIPIEAAQPTQHVIVWLTQLAPSEGKFQSRINEITLSGSAA